MSVDRRRLRQLGVLLLLAPSAWAAKPRFAIEPIDLIEIEAAQRDQLAAFYEVLLARVPNIRLAGSDVTERALARSWREDCPNDTCTQSLAAATDSLYGVFTEQRLNGAAGQWDLRGRVIRRDGAVVRAVMFSRPTRRTELAETGRAALAELVAQLDLGALPQTMPAGEPVAPTAEPLVATALTPSSPPRVNAPYANDARASGPNAGPIALLGVGTATLVGGIVVAALAGVGHAGLGLDAHGDVPAAHAADAQRVVAESRVATVLVPVGAVIAAAGVAWLLWPQSAPVKVGLGPGLGGGVMVLSGTLP